MSTDLKRPEDRISVKNGKTGKDVEFFMSYGLLNEMIKIIDARPETIATLDIDPVISEVLLAALFSERDDNGKVLGIVPFDLSIDDAEAVFDWIKEHTMGFFMRRLSKTKDFFDSRKDQLTSLGLSQTG